MKEDCHDRSIWDMALICIKQGWQCYPFLFVYLISCKSIVETLGLCRHFLRIPLSCFFPVCVWLLPYLRNPIGLLVPSLILSINVFAGSVQVWTGRIVSVFQLPTKSDWSRGKAVAACWFISNKAQLDTGYQFKIWEEHL